LLAVLALVGLTASILVQSQVATAAGPLAVDDHYSASPGASVEPAAPGVFANDSGVDPTTMTIRVTKDPTRGTATVTGPGTFRYDTEEIFTGTDEFTYCIVSKATPATCLSLAATVSIEFATTTAVDDTFTTSVNTPLTVPAPGVLANDHHVVPPMSVKFDAPAHGTLTAGSDGGLGYTPGPGFRGIDTVSYCITARAGAGTCLSNSATASIRVGIDDLTVVDDHYETDLGSALVVPAASGLLANDKGVLPTDPLLVTTPLHGTVTAVGANGAFTYTSTDGIAGRDSFAYCITAVAATPPCLSSSATVNVDVHAVAVRVGGADRFAVSAAVSARTFGSGVPVAYLASGTAFPDALSGSAAAGAQHGPVLLVTHDAVPEPVLAELRRLKPGKIIILGGTASIGSAVEDSVRPLTTSVVRYGGADRYAVSAKVSHESFSDFAPVAYVASGENFPDALSGSAAAGHLGGPVLLVTHDSVPSVVATELARLKPSRIVVLGGQNAIAAGVLDTLSAVAPTTRIGGADRFEVSAAVSKTVFPTGANTVYVASGTAFPDALSGSSAAVAHNAPVLLVTGTAIPAAVATELDRLNPSRIIVLGGTSAVSDAVLTSLKGYLAG
jgi:putative cell wall-binding protein